MLCFGPGHVKYIKEVIQTMKASDPTTTKYKLMSGRGELTAEIPSLRTGQDYVGCLDEDAGILRADKCLQGTLVTPADLTCTPDLLT